MESFIPTINNFHTTIFPQQQKSWVMNKHWWTSGQLILLILKVSLAGLMLNASWVKYWVLFRNTRTSSNPISSSLASSSESIHTDLLSQVRLTCSLCKKWNKIQNKDDQWWLVETRITKYFNPFVQTLGNLLTWRWGKPQSIYWQLWWLSVWLA